MKIEELKQIKINLYKLVDAWQKEIEEEAKMIAGSISLSDIRQALDRWEEIRSETSKRNRKITRSFLDAQDRYRDGLRRSMAGMGGSRGLHYKEREAEYEIKNIDTYQLLRNLEKIKEELTLFLMALSQRIIWLDQRRKEVLFIKKNEQYHSAKEYDTSP